MGSSILRMARWAHDLDLADAPPPVLERVRLQQLGIVGAIRAADQHPFAAALRGAGGSRGGAALVGGKTAPRRDAVRLHVALAGWLEHADHLVAGSPGPAAVPVVLAHARGHSLAELERALLAAQEVAGRFALSLLLAPAQPGMRPVVAAIASATAAGLLEGLSPRQLAHAIALAGQAAPRCTLPEQLEGHAGLAAAAGAVAGLDAVALAKSGVSGPLGSFDDHDGLVAGASPAPLRAAFTGLGRAWLTQTLCFQLHPGAPGLQAPLQAVQEILARHVKAADKRLRADQVDRIEVQLTAPAWWAQQRARRLPGTAPTGLVHRLPEAIGLLVAHHELGPDMYRADALEPRWDALAQVAGRVVIGHAWDRSLDLLDHFVDVLGPLFAGLTAAELDAASAAMTASCGGARLPRPTDPGLLLRLARTRPERLRATLRYQTGDLADARLDQLQVRLGADVRVRTTRGGSWPEHRDLAEGSPGWPWQETRSAVLRKWRGGDDVTAAEALMAAKGDMAGDDWVEALLAAD